MTSAALSVAVIVSAGQNPVSGAPRACRGDAVAFALGKELAGDALRVIHAGSLAEPALRDYLALGARTVEVVPVPAASDVCPSLAATLAGVSLVLTGCRAEIGAGSGLLPYALSKSLGCPIIANVLSVKISGGKVHVRQFLPKGKRRAIAAGLPAVLTVHPLAPVNLTYAFARGCSGRVTVAEATSASALACSTEPVDWKTSPNSRPLVRLRAEDKKSAHARLHAAITTESKSGVVAIEGSHVDKAQVVLNYLREHHLIDF